MIVVINHDLAVVPNAPFDDLALQVLQLRQWPVAARTARLPREVVLKVDIDRARSSYAKRRSC
jgi:hypothetical protein